MLLALWQACALACLASLSVNASPAQIDMGSASHMRALRDVVLPLAQASALGNVVSANVSQLPAAPAANGTLLLPVLNGTMPDDQGEIVRPETLGFPPVGCQHLYNPCLSCAKPGVCSPASCQSYHAS
jgi:hypothetical protein